MSQARWLLPFVVLTACILAGAPATAQRLVLATGALPPLGPSAEGPGFAGLVAREAFKRLGFDVEVIGLPAQRVLANVNEGIEDGDLLRIAGMEAHFPNLARVPESMMRFDFVAYAVAPGVTLGSFEALRSHSVGIVTGWRIYEDNVKATRELVSVRDPGQLFEMLKLGRVEVALLDRWQGLWAAKAANVQVRIIEPPFASQELFMYLNRRHAALVDRVAVTIADMKRDGAYQRLYDAVLRPLEAR